MSVERSLHIVSLDVPYPADYGGVIDIFHKLKALHAAGVRIRLHCFHRSRGPADLLGKFCESVDYYPRSRSLNHLLGPLPFIVQSRASTVLRKNLLKDDAPILMEGLHSTFLLSDPAFYGRKCIVRTHNIEHDYYHGLSRAEHKLARRWYLKLEAIRLRNYEPVLKRCAAIAAISPDDTTYFSETYGHAFYLPAFHPFEKVDINAVSAPFAFYHGNLSIPENNHAALFLVNQVFSKLPHKLVIAGSRPSSELRAAVARHPFVEVKDDLDPQDIHDLISKARINVLPTFQSTGIKLKLLAALFQGKTCLVNDPMVKNTGLESLCEIRNDADGFREAINREFNAPTWDDEKVAARRRILESTFSNEESARKLISKIFD